MKNLKEVLYFKRREKLQLEEDIKKCPPNFIRDSLCAVVFMVAAMIAGTTNSTAVCWISLFAVLFSNIILFCGDMKLIKLENKLSKLETEIDILHKNLNNQLEMNS